MWGAGGALQPLVRQVKELGCAGDVAGLEALFEPAGALGGGAVGEGIGDDAAAGLLLEAVVADLEGGVEGGVEVAGIEEVVLLLSVVGPDAGEVIGLELEAHGGMVGFEVVAAGADGVD